MSSYKRKTKEGDFTKNQRLLLVALLRLGPLYGPDLATSVRRTLSSIVDAEMASPLMPGHRTVIFPQYGTWKDGVSVQCKGYFDLTARGLVWARHFTKQLTPCAMKIVNYMRRLRGS